MNILSMLLGQQAASTLGGETIGNPIEVGMDRTGSAGGDAPVDIGPTAGEIDQYLNMGLDNTEAIKQRNRALEAGEAEADRKGMFGVKGTLRDVLGVLGDAFLVQSGNDSIYRPQRQQERISDAMAGSTINPRAAQERVKGVDPKFGTEFGLKTEDNRLANARNEISKGDLDRKVTDAAMARSGQIMAAAMATRDPAQIAAAEQAIQQLATITGIPVEQLMAGGTPELIAGREATANQNLRLPQQERMVGVAERNAGAREQSVGIAAKRLGLDERKFRQAIENRSFDEMMDLFGLSMDVQKEQGRNRRDATPPSRSSSRPSSAPSAAGGWSIRPAGN